MNNDSPNTNDSKDCNEISLLYKNLDFISKSYYSAEGIFPFWESAYALIVGQLLIAYFQMPLSDESNIFKKIILIISGIIFSLFWYRLVSMNRQHAKYLDKTMKHLEFRMNQEYEKNRSKFYGESKKQKIDEFKCENVITSFQYNWNWFINAELFPKKDARISTWYFRRLLPLSLIILWIFLLLFSF